MFYRENSQLSTVYKNVLKKTFLTLCKSFLDIFFPQNCFVCKKSGFAFCPTCRGRIPLETSPLPNNTISIWQYSDKNLQKALWGLKYRGKKELAHDLSESLYDAILEKISDLVIFQDSINFKNISFVVVPIPIHAKRKKERGYNQSELLSKELCKLNPKLFTIEKNVLIKIKHTKSQVSVTNREKRLKNVRGSFSLQYPEKIRGKNIIIVDDFSEEGKKPNYQTKKFVEKIEREYLFDWLKAKDPKIEFVFHLGARTDTTEFDYSIHEELNVEYSKKIWNYCRGKNPPRC